MRLLSIFVFVLCLCSPAVASGGRVVLVVAGNLSIRDVADPLMPHLYRMIEDGSAALMNVRTGRPNKLVEPVVRPGMEAGCVSLGAGTMAVGGAETRAAANASDLIGGVPAADTYSFRMGEHPGRCEVIHVDVARVRRANAEASYRAVPGSLGSALREAGIRTAVIGNSDIPGEPHREAVAIAMDRNGLVDVGDVSSSDLAEPLPDSAYGVRANNRVLLRELQRALRLSRFVVLDFGDTYRADRYAELCADLQAARIRREAVSRLDALVGEIRNSLDLKRDSLIVLSPTPRLLSDLEDEKLTPVLAVGPRFGGGALTSPSTRRVGLVTMGDVAPTVLSLLGVSPPRDVVGRTIVSAKCDETADALLRMNYDASLQSQRQAAMRGASVAQSVVVVLVTLAAVLGVSGLRRRAASWFAVLPGLLPIAMLSVPLIYSGGLVGAAAWLVALTLLLLGAVRLVFRTPLRAFTWICCAIVVALLIDIARGAPLISSSIAGYSMVEGARYYGIGNELAGTLVGATLVGVGLLLSSGRIPHEYSGLLAAAVFILVFAFIGSSGLGANAGDALSFAPAIAVALLWRRGRRLSSRTLAIVFGASLLAVAAVFAADALRGGGAQSHIGRAAGLAASGDALGIIEVAQRKLALNFMLVSTSVWSRLLGLSIVSSSVLYVRGRADSKGEFLPRELSAVALACVVATVGTFLLNDSGVLSAAACSVFLWMLLVLRALDRQSKR
jgi:hypothetical protein